MKSGLKYIIISILICGISNFAYSKTAISDQKTEAINKLTYQIIGNDTVLLAFLKDLYVFPPNKFKNKKQEDFYWKTVRDVKRALPYAKIVGSELRRVNELLMDIPRESERKKYLSIYEKEVFKKYENDLKKLSINQGRLLLKLIDRECSSTSYDLIKSYRGSVSAFFWQGVARLFGSNLKAEYDAVGNDKIVERVIILVESGQL